MAWGDTNYVRVEFWIPKSVEASERSRLSQASTNTETRLVKDFKTFAKRTEHGLPTRDKSGAPTEDALVYTVAFSGSVGPSAETLVTAAAAFIKKQFVRNVLVTVTETFLFT